MPNYLIALIPIALIALWLGLAAVDAGVLPKVKKWVNEPGNPVRLATWLIALAVVAVTWISPSDTLLGGLRTEAISTAFAVIVINELGIYRAALQEKRSIIEQMGSPVNDAALEAVRLARKNGWLEDGSLKGANFAYADLQGADLGDANLQGVSMFEANLQDAFLGFANLQDVAFQGTNLQGANLHGANLQGAKLLSVNLQDTDLHGVNLHGAYLSHVKYDSRTTWPRNFNPVTRDAQLVDADAAQTEADLPA